MESACLPHTAIPGTTRLHADFLNRFDRVAEFYGAQQGDPDPFVTAAGNLSFPDERRASLVTALGKQNGDHPHLDVLSKPGTVAVVTGQQVGLFSGPCYAVYKALTAAKLARELTNRGTPAVPVFWLATEDHDSEEINHCHVFDHRLMPRTLRAETAGFDQWPVGRIPIGKAPLEELRTVFGGLPFGEEVASLVADCYVEGCTFGEAFRRLMARLLSGQNLLFLDPLRPEIRELGAPLLASAAEAMPALVRLVLDRNVALEKAGYHAQVRVKAQSSLLFQLNGDRRLPLRQDDSRRASDEDPTRLSPNALLRPVMQDYVLPTVAYVAGPAEVAYLAQSHVLHQELLGRMPVVVPRSSFLLLDGRSARLLKRYGLGVDSCFHGADGLRDRIAAKLLDSSLGPAFATNRESVSGSISQLRDRLALFDPTIAEALDVSSRKILYQLGKIEAKAAREILRREKRADEEVAYLCNAVYPSKHLQERYYTVLPFLARYGLDLVHRLYENVNLACRDIVALTV